MLDRLPKYFTTAFVCFASLATIDCVSAPPAERQEFVTASDPNLISEAEIVASQATTVYEVLERTRPRLLTTQIDLPNGVEREVFMNGAWLGGLEQLRTVPAGSIREIRFVRSVDGGGGNGRSGGAIVLVAKPGR